MLWRRNYCNTVKKQNKNIFGPIMTNTTQIRVALAICMMVLAIALPSCKSCNKSDKAQSVAIDTTAVKAPDVRPMNTLNLPHADSTLIPVLSKIVDDAFDASAKKDYAKLGSLIIYKGPDSTRYGYDVFNAKNGYERNVVKITADVFNKWNRGVEMRNYGRVFDLDQPDGRKMAVLEVIFTSRKNLDRKFFGFLIVNNGEYKIIDVTSYL
ncbi:MAG: hypothetical protein JWO06_598 [Bacteroidota bacterium]|nr:hypothetical protein [Bacteroidota bacterium]